jgi:alkanesulfonate monooxygenase SsuD/methylene tetrahydromethanopterin reductase-like flavin-dependent oxidoreductase (luciferase family)
MVLRIGATASFSKRPEQTITQLERLGADSFWMYEIFQGYEAFARAGYLAAITTRPTIAVGVVNSYSRHPAIIAMGASFLANLTGGRATLVIGVGGDSWVGGMLGYDQSKPVQRFKEYMDILRSLLSGSQVDHHTSNFTLNKLKLSPIPEHPIPIIVACEQPEMMKLSGNLADGIYLEPSCCSLGYVKWVTQTIKETRRETRPFHVVANLPLRITEDVEGARSAIKPMLAFHLSFPGEGELYLEKAGFPPSLAEEIGEASGVRRLLREKRSPLEAFEKGIEKAAEMVPDKFVDQCAVMGDLTTCKDRLTELERAGLTDVVFSFQDDQSENLKILPGRS